MLEKKTSAFYMRQMRTRLREQGLAQKEVWVPPRHIPLLMRIEDVLRRSQAESDVVPGEAELVEMIREHFAH